MDGQNVFPPKFRSRSYNSYWDFMCMLYRLVWIQCLQCIKDESMQGRSNAFLSEKSFLHFYIDIFSNNNTMRKDSRRLPCFAYRLGSCVGSYEWSRTLRRRAESGGEPGFGTAPFCWGFSREERWKRVNMIGFGSMCRSAMNRDFAWHLMKSVQLQGCRWITLFWITKRSCWNTVLKQLRFQSNHRRWFLQGEVKTGKGSNLPRTFLAGVWKSIKMTAVS